MCDDEHLTLFIKGGEKQKQNCGSKWWLSWSKHQLGINLVNIDGINNKIERLAL